MANAYAVSLPAMMELTREPAGLPLLLLLRSVVTETTVSPVRGKEFAHQALLVSGDVGPERWQAIVTLIRKRYRYDQFPLYEQTARGWRAVRQAAHG